MAYTLDTTIERLCARIEEAPAEHKDELRLQLIRLIVFHAVRPGAPRRTRKAKPTAWRCTTCGKTGQRSLKNAAYCVACARSQPIGAAL